MFIEQFEKSAGVINSAKKAIGNVGKAVAEKAEGATLDYKAIKAEFKKKNPNIGPKSPSPKVKPPPPMGQVSKEPLPVGMQNVMRRPQGRFSV